ncbi:RNA polymerase sigma factor [Tellurirhabdus bombi]|uniref:RNA polymerase sigma factor n=1 Tax=Tellurirhabdus bombi TaxID=2907205 RepID=UPI00210605F1|nr:sigma-70 family RNA polymerase sigma factor [Tellurirhabdus bombi]
MIASHTDDPVLWQLLCEGDQRAFEQIMKRYYRALFRYGTRIWPDEDIVRDCLQEIFADIWVRRAALRNVQSVNFYLIKAVRNRLLYQKRQQKTVSFSTELTNDQLFVSEFTIEKYLIAEEEARQQAAKLETMLNALPPRQKEIIHLRFFQNLSPDEIADLMSLNRQSVYNLLHETLRKLRHLWGLVFLLSYWLLGR